MTTTEPTSTGKSKTRIRVAPSMLPAGLITCGICGTDFTPDTGAGSDEETES